MPPEPVTSSLFVEATKLGFVVLLLLAAVYLLVRWVRQLEAQRDQREKEDRLARDEREKDQRAECRKEIASLVGEVRRLEESRYQDQKQLNSRCLDVLDRNAETFQRLVDLEKLRTPTGKHPAIKDT